MVRMKRSTATNSAAACAASLKLDSHGRLAVPGQSPAEHSLPINTNHLWERACSRKRCISQRLHQLTDRFREQARYYALKR